MKWIALLCAGALGAVARYGLSSWIQSASPGRFPWGTLGVNLLGCLLFGIIWTLFEGRLVISHTTRVAVLTGFLGAFTTFSTFGFENAQLFSQGEWVVGTLNLVLQPAVGMLCFLLGQSLAKGLA
jgi:fluoride exporter